jgi:hypothetical protein
MAEQNHEQSAAKRESGQHQRISLHARGKNAVDARARKTPRGAPVVSERRINFNEFGSRTVDCPFDEYEGIDSSDGRNQATSALLAGTCERRAPIKV